MSLWHDISEMNHQPSGETCQWGCEKLSPRLFTYWLAPCVWLTLMRTTHTASNGMSSLGGKRAVTVAPTGGRGHAINEGGETLSTNKTNLLLVFAAWNHTLAKLVEEEPALLQLLCSLRLKVFSPLLFPFLCLCEVQLNTSLYPARSFTQSYCW